MKRPLPPRDIAWFDVRTGVPTEIFYEYMRSIDARVLREPVSVTDAPANGDVLTYDATEGVWEPA